MANGDRCRRCKTPDDVGRIERHIAMTERTYDAIAQRYARQWSDASIASLDHARSRFAAAVALNEPVLDLGCGPGRDLAWLNDRGYPVIGIDRSAAMLHLAAARVPDAPLVRADVRRLPVRSHSVGGWWACAVFLHLNRCALSDALAEARRVTRAGGTGLLTVKRGAGAALEPVFGTHRHRYVRYWSDEHLNAAVRATGWAIVDQWTAEDTHGRHPWLTRLLRKE